MYITSMNHLFTIVLCSLFSITTLAQEWERIEVDGLANFEIAGEDKVFYPANAKIKDESIVIVKAKEVTDPVAVRYAWNDWVKGTLFDRNFLPVSS